MNCEKFLENLPIWILQIQWRRTMHRGQKLKQINIAKYVSKFLIYGAKMFDKCIKSKKKNFCTLSFFVKSSYKILQIWYAMFCFATHSRTNYILNTFRVEKSLQDLKQSCISWKIWLEMRCPFFDFVCFNGCHFT